MNRIIKFRAWHIDQKRLLTNIESLQFDVSGNISYVIENDYYTPSQLELVQFTGLKDKNGKEIYEGDIVIVDEDDNENAVIEYIEEDAMFSIKLSNVIENFWNISGDTVEVIGNIYENKDLIK